MKIVDVKNTSELIDTKSIVGTYDTALCEDNTYFTCVLEFYIRGKYDKDKIFTEIDDIAFENINLVLEVKSIEQKDSIKNFYIKIGEGLSKLGYDVSIINSYRMFQRKLTKPESSITPKHWVEIKGYRVGF
jgi:hypothetical protein